LPITLASIWTLDSKYKIFRTDKINLLFEYIANINKGSEGNKKGTNRYGNNLSLSAEKEGFEPPLAFTKTVFKTAAFNRSAISPFLEDCKNTNFF
jgi:hypothetical protein